MRAYGGMRSGSWRRATTPGLTVSQTDPTNSSWRKTARQISRTSEARFARLEAAAAQAEEDGSAPKLERLADARAAMTPFDNTREAWNASRALVAAGDAATRGA